MPRKIKSLTDKVREIFDRDNVQVNLKDQRIECYWMLDPRGKVWVPYGGGPLYHDQAKDEARWLAKHIEEFRSLLPKAIKDWPIACGELQTSTFPGIFHVA
jgi:hypothetical protein